MEMNQLHWSGILEPDLADAEESRTSTSLSASQNCKLLPPSMVVSASYRSDKYFSQSNFQVYKMAQNFVWRDWPLSKHFTTQQYSLE